MSLQDDGVTLLNVHHGFALPSSNQAASYFKWISVIFMLEYVGPCQFDPPILYTLLYLQFGFGFEANLGLRLIVERTVEAAGRFLAILGSLV